MKILLSAFIGSHNLGDEAIAEVVIDALEKEPDIQLSVLSVNPTKTRKLTRKSTKVYRAGLGNFVRRLWHGDALVLGGGGIIQDESSVINMIYYYLQTFVARRVLRKPVFWIFVGVGPIKTRISHAMLRDMARMTTHALVRDKESAALLTAHKFTSEQVVTAYDIVFNYPVPPTAGPAKYPGSYMLFCPRDWFFVATVTPTRFALKRARRDPNSRLQVYRLHLLRLVEQCLQDNPDLTIVGVAFFYSQDLDLLQWIKNNLGREYAGRYVVEANELTPREFIAVAQDAAAVLGVRLHSLILGAVAGRPLVPLVYSAKVGNLVNYLGVGTFTTHLKKPDFDVQETAANVRKALHSRPAQSDTMLAEVCQANLDAFEALVAGIRSKTTRS